MRRNWLRFCQRAIGRPALVAAVLGTLATSSPAQEAASAADSPARVVPSAGLGLYLEFDGLDAHEEGWQKTAAYRILNETPTGTMFEDLFSQVYARLNTGTISAPDALKLVKHVAKSGFVIAGNVVGDEGAVKAPLVMVLRKAFTNKEVRPLFARYLQTLPGPGTKTESKVISGHKLVTGKRGNSIFAWWVEETKKEDLIVVTGLAGSEGIILDTLDGKTASVLTNPVRAELARSRAGFERVGMALLDIEPFARVARGAPVARFRDQTGLTRIDLTFGFQAEAMESVVQVHQTATAAASKVMANVKFDRSAIPGIPTGTPGFLVLAADFKTLIPQLVAAPAARPAYEQAVAALKQNAKIRLEEDVLAQLGPKLTAYVTPPKAAGSGGGALPGVASLFPGLGAGADSLPKFALLLDVANPTAFGKTLDELMAYVNRELKSAFTARAPGGEAPPPPGGGRRGGPPSGPAPEFRVMGGETKSYVLNVPPELARSLPAGLRPAIRLGPKQLAIATSADVARQAIDAKGSYAPPAEIASAFGRLPGQLNWLMVADPRGSTPEVLAALPGKLQAALNTIGLPAPAGAGPGPAPAPGGAPEPSAGLPAAPSPIVLNVDPSKLPAAAAVRKLLFPAIHTVEAEGNVIRFTSRVAFPMIPDPMAFAVGFKAGQAMSQGKRPGANGVPPAGVTDGLFDVPSPPGAPGSVGRPGQPGRPGARAGGGPAAVRPD